MRPVKIFAALFMCAIITSCSNQLFPTNGETIYKTGKNFEGEKMLDKKASSIKFVNSCITCHGKKGDKMKNVSVKFSDLSNPDKFPVPYNDTLFYRFLDKDIKSDGSKAGIGVIWKMNERDKKSLLNYLKSL